MVVAGPGLGDGLVRAVLAQRADRRGRGDPGHRLQDRGHLGPGELVVAVAALNADPDQAAVDQAVQVGGRGRGLDPRVAGQVGGGQGPAAGQGGQHRGPGGMADERPDGGQVPVAAVGAGAFFHGAIVTRGRFTLA